MNKYKKEAAWDVIRDCFEDQILDEVAETVAPKNCLSRVSLAGSNLDCVVIHLFDTYSSKEPIELCSLEELVADELADVDPGDPDYIAQIGRMADELARLAGMAKNLQVRLSRELEEGNQ